MKHVCSKKQQLVSGVKIPCSESSDYDQFQKGTICMT